MSSLVSIIVPIFNVEKYLKRCLESIVQQTYSNLEIILVDDGSTDSCPQICDEYETKDSRIKVLHKSNGGLSDARNCGVRLSRGDYICFVDSDDYIDSTYVEVLLNVIVKGECDISVCYFRTVDECGRKVDKNNDNSASIIEYCSGIEMISHMYDKYFVYTVVAWNKMYKRKIIESFEYPVGMLHEDEATTCKYLYNADKVGFIHEELYNYYVRSDSITNSNVDIKRLDDKLNALQMRMFFLQEKGLNEFYSKDNLRLLKQILKNYCIASYLSKEYKKKMRNMYRKEYPISNKCYWNIKNRIIMLVSYIVPSFYGKLRGF